MIAVLCETFRELPGLVVGSYVLLLVTAPYANDDMQSVGLYKRVSILIQIRTGVLQKEPLC
jgi:hypothetical protein